MLSGTRVYLAGPVEWDQNAGSWRSLVTEKLAKYSVQVYDPLVKPKWLPEVCHVNPKLYREALTGKTINFSKELAYEANIVLRDFCLKCVSSADWIICWMPLKFTSGTFEEIYLAAQLNKPVLFCMPDGLTSTWIPPIFSTPETMDRTFFPNWDTLLNHVEGLDNGTIEMDPLKWLSVCYKRGL